MARINVFDVAPELGVRGCTFALAPAGFLIRKRERCPDCELREALAADGRVVWLDGRKLSHGCSTCQGHGDLPAFPRRDLYAEAA